MAEVYVKKAIYDARRGNFASSDVFLKAALSINNDNKLLLDNGFIGNFYPKFEEMNVWKDVGNPTQRLRSHSLALNNVLQKLLDIFPNSFTILRYLYGL